ncbi:C4-dicarboxylate transporter DcuC [Turicimonas muris]|uniref:C4-dicarboxylate transporter DcuC n=1 Tax=Turicimonas muris TaxID=1796652 RepID=UPI002494E463|nr:C4-dicarboxylate transporter DcuC [Turicimonas muris]
MSLTAWIAVAVVIVTVYCLIKRYETRLVLFTAGLFLCCISMKPMMALDQFAKSMTTATLIMAICGSMGFAYVVTHTQCDKHLVSLLAAPLKKIGILLIPAATAVTFFVNIALPSAAGCAAAVGATLIPVMVRSGIRPAAAGAAILMGTYGSCLSPGMSHNNFVAKISNMDVMDVIGLHTPFTLIMMAIGLVGITIVCLVLRDNKPSQEELDAYYAQAGQAGEIGRINILKALAPLVPLCILVAGNQWFPAIKMGVAQAMVCGAIYTLAVSWTNPQQFSKEFFKGMGSGYGSVMGIIIAAGVFAAGLRAAGLVDAFVAGLKASNEIARWGGSLGPFILAVITGSGDAATFAFNEAVTPHAADFGMQVPNLGALALISGSLGRTMSPIAGVVIVVSGLAMVQPMQLVKRTFIPMIIAVFTLALIMV